MRRNKKFSYAACKLNQSRERVTKGARHGAIRRLRASLTALGLMAAGAAGGVENSGETTLSAIQVRSSKEDLSGVAGAASEGVVSGERLSTLPLLRPAEALEQVPGLIVTQHAGDGKANQYFLRGFNLDHGTDFATYVDGMPVNLPTHAHGHGYTDLNFLIPELVDTIRYRKGPYFAEEGDFSSAGSARIGLVRRIDGTLASLGWGQGGYARSLVAGSPELAGGRLLYALEAYHNNGPWQVPENYRKWNGVLRYSQGSEANGWSVTGMSYSGRWTSTDQIPERAVAEGLIGRYGSLDDSTGGSTRRTSLSAQWAQSDAAGRSRANAWLLDYSLDLWSNFTYYDRDPVNGDQFRQDDRRRAGGFDLARTTYARLGGVELENTLGLTGRHDRIGRVGLYYTADRETLSTVRQDRVEQSSVALCGENQARWTPWLRSIVGARIDYYRFHVDSSLAENGGRASDSLVSPKFGLVFGPWRRTELYVNYGLGFHSNDARGTTLRVNPENPAEPASRVTPLVRSRGGEVGVRSEPLAGWNTTVSLWQLDLASELLFVGDAGTTEPSRPSRRQGVEWANFFTPASWLTADLDLSWSRARFRDDQPIGNRIPGAIETAVSAGLAVDNLGPWFGALRFRYFGPRPLVEDNSVRSSASALTSLRLGYKVDRRTRLALDVFNLFDRKVNDIEYYYASRLRNEAASVEDVHFHPVEGRTVRLTLTTRF